MLGCYLVSFFLYSQILKQISMGMASAIWAGHGGVGRVGALVWRDQISLWPLPGMALVMIRAWLLNAVTPPSG